MSEFEWAVKNGDLNAVKSAISSDKTLADGVLASSSRPPLCVAADFGQTEIISYLIESGANINRPDKYGITPLLSAVYEGHDAAVAMLLSKGADRNGKSPDGKPYIECAEKDEIRDLLRK